MLATDDKALQRLQTFEQWGGEIVIEDLGWVPFTDWFTAPFKLSGDGRVLVIDDDASPVEAAQYLTIALKQGLRYGPYRNFVMSTWGITEPDLDTWRDACEAMIEDMSISAATWANLMPLIASVVNEPFDFVITIHEISEGDYASAIGLLPFVPSGALSQSKKVLIQTTNGSQLMHLSKQSVNLVQSVMSPAAHLTPQQAVATLKQAGLTVKQRMAGIRSRQYPSLPLITRKSKSTKKLQQSLTDNGFPMPSNLFEGKHVPQVHHTLPLQHADWFMAHGIDVNDPQYLRWVRKSDHTKLHNETSALAVRYNNWWELKKGEENVRLLNNLDEFSIQEIQQMISDVRTEFNLSENIQDNSWTFLGTPE